MTTKILDRMYGDPEVARLTDVEFDRIDVKLYPATGDHALLVISSPAYLQWQVLDESLTAQVPPEVDVIDRVMQTLARRLSRELLQFAKQHRAELAQEDSQPCCGDVATEDVPSYGWLEDECGELQAEIERLRLNGDDGLADAERRLRELERRKDQEKFERTRTMLVRATVPARDARLWKWEAEDSLAEALAKYAPGDES